MTTTENQQIDEDVEPTGPANWAEAAMESISGDLAPEESYHDVAIGWTTHSLEAADNPTDTLVVLTASRVGFGRTVPSELPSWVELADITNVDAIEGLRYPGIVLELSAEGCPSFYLGVESAFVDSFVAALQRSAAHDQPHEEPATAPAEPEPSPEQVAQPPVAVFDDPPVTSQPEPLAADEETVTSSAPDYSSSPWDSSPVDPAGVETAVPAPADTPATVLIDLPQVDPGPLVDPEPLVSGEPVADMFAPVGLDGTPAEVETSPLEAAPFDASPLDAAPTETALVEPPVEYEAPGQPDLGSMESSLPSVDDTPNDDLPDALRIDTFDHESLLAVGDTPPWLDPEMRWPRPLRGVQYLGGHPNHPRKRKNGIFAISPNGIDAEGAGFGDWSMNVQWAFINDIMVVGPDEATFNLGVRIGPKNSVISVEMVDGTTLNFEVRGKGPSSVRADLGSALGMATAARQYRASHGDADAVETGDPELDPSDG